jgi:Protein of unknown function (DUF4197)
MKNLIATVLLLSSLLGFSQKTKISLNKDSIAKKLKNLKNIVPTKLSNEEVIKGLKEALSIGTNNSSQTAGKLDGFYKNPNLFIPWPEEAVEVKNKLTSLGLSSKVEEFEMSLNRAAEEAALNAAPIFLNAITSMNLQDGFSILKGTDTAATNYLRKSTYEPLKDKFLPTVQAAIAKVQVTSYWNPLISTYNKIPFVKKQNPDLDQYVTNKAINGLMLLIANEEKNIRNNPAARVSDLLKKVFAK